MKWFKLILLVFGFLILIVAFAVGSFLFLINPEKFKTELIAEVQAKTGYQLIIDGPISWSLLPRLGIHVDSIILKAPNSSYSFLDARQVTIAADWSSLLNSKKQWQGHINATSLRLIKMNFGETSADLHLQNDVLTIAPINAALYQGTLQGAIIGQRFFAIPHWQWDIKLKQIQLQSLLNDVNDHNNKINISGAGYLNIQAETDGNIRDEMVNQINGTGDFYVENGVLEGIDLNYYIKSAEAFIRNNHEIEINNEGRTPFTKLNGSFVIEHGQVETNNLLLKSQLFSVKAKGSVALLNRSLELQLQIKPKENEHIKWYIPLIVTGTLSSPEIRLDTLEIQQLITGEQIEKAKQKALDQIQKHVPGKTGDFLKNLLR